MKLTAQTVTREALEALAVNGKIFLVLINTDKLGFHYLAGFESIEQSRMYKALLQGKSFDKSVAQYQGVDCTYDCIAVEKNMTITPVTQYRIKKTDPVYSTHPLRSSKDLLRIANDLLASTFSR